MTSGLDRKSNHSVMSSAAEQTRERARELARQPWFCCNVTYVARFKHIAADDKCISAIGTLPRRQIERLQHKTFLTCSTRGIHIGGKCKLASGVGPGLFLVTKRKPNMYVDARSVVRVRSAPSIGLGNNLHSQLVVLISIASADIYNIDLFKFSSSVTAEKFIQLTEIVLSTRRDRFSESDRLSYALGRRNALATHYTPLASVILDAANRTLLTNNTISSMDTQPRLADPEEENMFLRREIQRLSEELQSLRSNTLTDRSLQISSTQAASDGWVSSGPTLDPENWTMSSRNDLDSNKSDFVTIVKLHGPPMHSSTNPTSNGEIQRTTPRLSSPPREQEQEERSDSPSVSSVPHEVPSFISDIPEVLEDSTVAHRQQVQSIPPPPIPAPPVL